MILTVTLNPSIDVSYNLNCLHLDAVNRVQTVNKTAGGKGLNVSRVIHQLGGQVLATGVLGGFFGEYFLARLDEDGIPHAFSTISQETRSCIAILHEGQQTEVLEAGPQLSPEEVTEFFDKFQEILTTYPIATITLSGSQAKGFGSDTYSQLIALANQKGIKVLLDTSGKNLELALKSPEKPYLIKPNRDELTQLLDLKTPIEIQDLPQILSDPLFANIPYIVVSLGADGAFVASPEGYYHAQVPTIAAVNPVGSGDATLAGLAHAIDAKASSEDIIKNGMTCGVLNALNLKTGSIHIEEFDTMFNQIRLTPVGLDKKNV